MGPSSSNLVTVHETARPPQPWETVDSFALPPSPDDYPPDTKLTAVIDVGSGSARAVVMQLNTGGVQVLAQQRLALNLMSHVDRQGTLDAEGVASTLDAIEDFVQVCRGYGVTTIHAVGTEALRRSHNAAEISLAARRRYGVELRVISGYEEAGYCFIGAVQGLPVSRGLLADLGGGSMELVGFFDRGMETRHTLPLGSLHIANRFRLTDRPTGEDLDAAYRYARQCLEAARVPRLERRDTLVGSGGSMRLLSKLDRRRRRPYPVQTIHGYCIGAKGLSKLVDRLASRSLEERSRIPGMNPERTHSIVGGAVVAQALLHHTGAESIMLSGHGLREGLARQPEPLLAEGRISLMSVDAVRRNTLKDVMGRFAPRFTRRGARRAALAARIARAVWAGRRRRLTSSLGCAALLLDLGSVVDFYNRLNRAASILSWTDLPGFSHREAAQMAAMLLLAEKEKLPKKYRKTSILSDSDRRHLGQAALVLLLADELERRLPPTAAIDSVNIAAGNGGLTITTPAWSRVSAPGLHHRWEKEFKHPVQICRGEP